MESTGGTGMPESTGSTGMLDPPQSTGMMEQPDVGLPPPATQTLLLAISTPLGPTLPLLGIVWETPGAPGTVDLELQWLAEDQLVGAVYQYPGIVLDEQGGFVWEIVDMDLPGDANPITGGPAIFSAVINAVPISNPYCGPVRGEVSSPIMVSLTGSTHAMTAIPNENALPPMIPMACP